jgi:hypothetical protein
MMHDLYELLFLLIDETQVVVRSIVLSLIPSGGQQDRADIASQGSSLNQCGQIQLSK